MRLNIALLLACSLVYGIVAAASEEIRVNRASLHTECKLPDGSMLVLSLEIAPYSEASGQREFPYGGDSKSYRPRRVIESISVMIAGRSITIPPAAYIDLGDPSLCTPSLLRDGKNLILQIDGGNHGWSSYSADVVIRGSTVVERRVTNTQSANVGGKNYKPDVKTFKA